MFGWLCVWADRYDTTASGNWYKADEPWGAYLQTDGNPAVTVSPYESDPSSGSFNPQAHTTWVPTDWNSWPNCESMPIPPTDTLCHCCVCRYCSLPRVAALTPVGLQTTSTATASTKWTAVRPWSTLS